MLQIELNFYASLCMMIKVDHCLLINNISVMALLQLLMITTFQYWHTVYQLR